MAQDMDLIAAFPPQPPQAALAFTAVVEVGQWRDLGIGPLGQRRLIPVLGGTVQAGPAAPGFDGVVLPGGADRQLIRPDGIKELDALYEVEVGSGQIVTIRNRVIVDEKDDGGRYAMSVIRATVPEGPLAGLNRRLLVGTLQSARPKVDAVVIRAWAMDC